MDDKTKNKHLKVLFYIAYAVIGWFAIIHWLPTAILLLLPFILAYFVAFITTPLEKFFERKCKIPRKIAALIAWALALCLLTGAVSFIVYKFIMLIYGFSQNASGIIQSVVDAGNYWQTIFMEWRDKLPESVIVYLDEATISITQNLIGWIGSFAASFLSGVKDWAAALPNILLFWLIFVIASFFMCKDFSFIKRSVAVQFPMSIRGKVIQIKDSAAMAVGKYLKGMGTMYVIVFCIILTGLLILRVHYAFWIALGLALLDIFPILGVGIVLVPWGLFNIFLAGNVSLGIGMIVLYIINNVVRQLCEPKVMSNALGLHPLVTLIAVFIGFKTFGFIGVIAFPILALVLVSLQRAGLFTIWKEE